VVDYLVESEAREVAGRVKGGYTLRVVIGKMSVKRQIKPAKTYLELMKRGRVYFFIVKHITRHIIGNKNA